MKNLVFVIVASVGCGKVSLAPDASVDAPLRDAVACTSDQTDCSGTCVETANDNNNCGGCGLTCTGSTSCSSGHCVNYTASCATIFAHDQTTPSGFQTLFDGTRVYCDMEDGGVGYRNLSWAAFNSAPAGYTMLSLADFQGMPTEKAFIALYNSANGALPVLAPFTSSNCAVKIAATDAADLGLMNGNAPVPFVAPATVGPAGPTQCNQSGGYTNGSYGFYIFGNPIIYGGTALPDDFFTMHPATMINSGGDNTNPAFFWIKST